jgi:hypothetical protein
MTNPLAMGNFVNPVELNPSAFPELFPNIPAGVRVNDEKRLLAPMCPEFELPFCDNFFHLFHQPQ